MTTSTSRVGLLAVPDAVLTGPLTDLGPRIGADSGEPMTSGRTLYTSPDGSIETGIWACTPGGWAIVDRPDTETVRILSGRARLTDAGGESVELTAGDVLVLPKGWSGRWDIIEPVRKHYVTVR